MINCQVPLVFWGDAVITAVYHYQRTPNNGLTKWDDCNGYQAPYQTPYEMLQAFGKLSHNTESNEISKKAPLHPLRRFRCYAIHCIPEPQCDGKFIPRSTPKMMFDYVHDSTTLWRIWNPVFRVVSSQSDVICYREKNAHALCLHTDLSGIIELPEQTEYGETNEMGGDGVLHDRTGTNRTGDGNRIGDHDWIHNDTEHNLPNVDNCWSLLQNKDGSLRSPHKGDTPPVSREPVVHKQQLPCDTDTACCGVYNSKYSCVPPDNNRIPRSQVKISTNALIMKANTLASTTSDGLTDSEAMDSLQHEHWNRAMDEQCTLTLQNNSFTTAMFEEARQLRVKLIGSKRI